MIDFKKYASGSTGNLYTVDDGHTRLMIEMGLPIRKIKKHLEFKLSEISGALLTHSHSDHSQAADDVAKCGVDVYASTGTIAEMGLTGHRIKTVKAGDVFSIGTWKILPFEAQHDAPDPLSFLLMNQAGEKMLFATDTYFIRHRFKGLTVIAVECNYHYPILMENIEAGIVPSALKNRLITSHFEFENVKAFLAANDLSGVIEIHLIHMSSTNSDPEMFRTEIQQLTGKPVYI